MAKSYERAGDEVYTLLDQAMKQWHKPLLKHNPISRKSAGKPASTKLKKTAVA